MVANYIQMTQKADYTIYCTCLVCVHMLLTINLLFVQVMADSESRLHSLGIQVPKLLSDDLLSLLTLSVKVTNGLILDLHYLMKKTNTVLTTHLRNGLLHCLDQGGLYRTPQQSKHSAKMSFAYQVSWPNSERNVTQESKTP